MTDRNTAQLIPREVLFGNPDKASTSISPDGKKIGYLAPVDGVLNVWVGPADDPSSARPATDDKGRGIRFYVWAYTNDHILYIQDKEGDENWHLYSVDLTTNQTKDLTPLEGVHAQIQQVSHKMPHEIIVALNDRDPQFHDLYLIDIKTGERRLIQKNDEFAGYITDDDYNIRFAMRMTPDGGSEVLRPTAKDDWELFIKISMEDMLTTSPIGFDKTGRLLYMIDSRERDTAALVALDLDTGEQRLLAQDTQADVSGLMIHPTEKTVQAVAFTHERKRWQILDSSIEEDIACLHGVSDGDVEVVGRTLDDRCWIVAYAVDNGPVRYYRYDRATKDAQFLFTNRKALEGLPLAKMHPVVIKSRDKLDLVSYYTLPAAFGDEPKPGTPLPMVLLVHGGPWARDTWGYDPLHQMLANRGYAVMSVNFRGSTGLGKAFINSANYEWAAKMHDDLVDAVDWAIDTGIADPERVAIMGGSYGGYATLVGMTFTPDLFACGVDIVGPSNLVTLLESIPPYWQPQIEMFTMRVGDHRTEEGRAFLVERSPLTHVDRIEKPLLIGQGANDPRVKQAESDQIVAAMQEKGIPVTYALYSDEGHGFARPENRLSFFAVAEAFLAAHLSGTCEPIGDAFRGSTIAVPAGVEQVVDLDTAMTGHTSKG
ncbi:S9 family peptidase [Candidatus Bipolaricaulota bacterium]|nr:S9 family peptidase [Candidatus Bipolaricaulota bacterium]